MPDASAVWIGLIRGIGPTTHRAMSMASLRDGCREAGLADVRTVLATGNVICTSAEGRDGVRRRLERVVAAHGLGNPVLVRSPAEIGAAMDACPFREAAASRPSKLLLNFLDGAAAIGAVETLDALGPEAVAGGAGVLYVDYVDGVARSRLTPDRIARATGCVATARNWSTCGKLAALA